MAAGTQTHKWIILSILGCAGIFIASSFPHPTDAIRPYILIVISLIFIKHLLEYLLNLPISGLKGLYIPVNEKVKRNRFIIISILLYVALMYWIIAYLY